MSGKRRIGHIAWAGAGLALAGALSLHASAQAPGAPGAGTGSGAGAGTGSGTGAAAPATGASAPAGQAPGASQAGAPATAGAARPGTPAQSTIPAPATMLPGQVAPGAATPGAIKPSQTNATPSAPGLPNAPGTPSGTGTNPGSPVQQPVSGSTMQPSQALAPGQIQSQGITLNPSGASATPGVPNEFRVQVPSGIAPGAIPPAPTGGPAITLDEALTRARANSPAFSAAFAASRVAALDRSIARAALLPSVEYHNQVLYTQPALVDTRIVGTSNLTTPNAPRFIANNDVREYMSQGIVNERLGLAQYTLLSLASANAAIAAAQLEISRRGLTSTVVNLFYNSTSAQGKLAVEQRALNEAADFVRQTQEREAVREAAHADVLKAQLTMQQRQRDLADAELGIQKARLDLGVLIFPDPRAPFTVTLPESTPLPTRAAVETAANTNNPELRSALSTLQARTLGITGARAAYLPDLALNYTYGIDATQFAITGTDGQRNLGYSASATLDIPVWDWLATQHRIRQAQILRDSAKVALSGAQRNLIVQLEEFYSEAAVAQGQLDSLQLTVNTAAESLRLTRLRYTAGESTVLEVVDAQNSLTTAELALADGTVRYHIALANLQVLTGTI